MEQPKYVVLDARHTVMQSNELLGGVPTEGDMK